MLEPDPIKDESTVNQENGAATNSDAAKGAGKKSAKIKSFPAVSEHVKAKEEAIVDAAASDALLGNMLSELDNEPATAKKEKKKDKNAPQVQPEAKATAATRRRTKTANRSHMAHSRKKAQGE